MDSINRNRVKVPFGDLATRTAFTLNGYFTFIYAKVGATVAEQVGCTNLEERYLELTSDEPVYPVFLPAVDPGKIVLGSRSQRPPLEADKI